MGKSFDTKHDRAMYIEGFEDGLKKWQEEKTRDDYIHP